MMNAEVPAAGLSVVILHYNRPWCLEISASLVHRQLAREGLPFQIILADDGSDRRVWPLFDRLPFDDCVIQSRRSSSEEGASVYDTLSQAYDRIRHAYVLYLQDDFWFVPQGFRDHDKSHLAALRVAPDFDVPWRPFTGAVQLLEERPHAHLVELARSFANPRYRCTPESERAYGGIRFRAKEQAMHPHFYSCDWPHVTRTREERTIRFPTGRAIWSGEQVLDQCRRDAFGDGDWTYDPEHCFFAHINVFTWRGVLKDGLSDRALRWEGGAKADDLPFAQQTDLETNRRLLHAYVRGQTAGACDLYQRVGPLGYLERLARLAQ